MSRPPVELVGVTSEHIQVRQAGADDVDVLVRLRAEMFTAMGIESSGALWRTRAADWFTRRLDDPAYGFFVVIDSAGTVVACAVGAIRDAAPSPEVPDGQDVLISNICTVPDARGQGHGRRAFDAVMHWARSTGVHRAELMATEDGRKIYDGAGFTVTHCPSMRAAL